MEDKVTDIIYTYLDGPHRGIISASASGLCAAMCVTSQIEYIITSSHMRQLPIQKTVMEILKEKSVSGLLLPPGMIAMAGREIPFAASLFHFRPLLRDYIYEKKDTNIKSLLVRFFEELSCGIMTSSFATPISHAPSVIAAYQQAHSVSLRVAISQIYNLEGMLGFTRGILPRTISLAGTFTVVPIVLELLSPKSLHHLDNE